MSHTHIPQVFEGTMLHADPPTSVACGVWRFGGEECTFPADRSYFAWTARGLCYWTSTQRLPARPGVHVITYSKPWYFGEIDEAELK